MDDGLQPGTTAPVWRMDAFRNRFLRRVRRIGARMMGT